MTSFDTFVRRQVEVAKPQPQIDVQGRIEWFIKQLSEFYTLVCDNWLKSNIDAGEITVEEKSVTIHEELLGEYQVKGLNIIIGNLVVRLRPVGTILIGTRGRIDICYGSRRSMFVLAGEHISSPRTKAKEPGRVVWKYVDRSGLMKYVSLDADRFQQIILDLING